MPSLDVRPFRRADRAQLTELVNAHVGAVVPGISVSVNAVLNQLEREPAEFVVDPWVCGLARIRRRRAARTGRLRRAGAVAARSGGV